jgi:Holliday junction resolvase RusA-like endonuclease
MYKLVIEGDPLSVNATYKTNRRSRNIFLSDDAVKYANNCRIQAKVQWKRKPLECNLEVSYHYYFRDNKRRDHLNFNKLLNDHLSQIVWKDDKQIKISHHYTMIDKERPRIEIIIREI